jgi:hypothetical protein
LRREFTASASSVRCVIASAMVDWRRVSSVASAIWDSRLGDGSAVLDRKPRLVQLRHLAQRCRDDGARCRPGGTRLAELDFELACAPGEGGVDQAVERERRRVGDDRHHVVELHPRLAACEQRELAHLMAGRQSVAAEQRNQGGAGLRRNRKVGVAHLVIDETNEIPFSVGVARERHGILGALA